MRTFQAAALLVILTGAQAWAADHPFPMVISAPATDDFACGNAGVIDDIMDDFAWAERTQWHRGFVMQSIENPRPSGHRFAEPGLVKRDYCVADTIMSNGMQFPVYYAIERGLGFVGIGSDVDFCVPGLDPWHVHDGDCRTVR